MLTALLFSLALLLPSQPSLHHAAQDTIVGDLPEVSVEAVRGTETSVSAPFSVTVQPRPLTEFTMEGPTYVRDVLRDVPGVWMNDRGHFALGERLVVRGMGWRSPFGVRGVQVLLDGVPLTMPDGQAFLDIVDPLFIRRTELVRGPSSLFWGNGSGGTLFLDTTPTADTPAGQLRARTGTHGLQQISAEAVVRPGDATWRIGVSDLRRVGHRANSDGRFTRALLSGEMAAFGDSRLRVVGAFVDQDARNPGSLTADEVAEDPSQANTLFDGFTAGKQSTQGQLGASLLLPLRSVDVDATLFGGFRNLENPLPFSFVAFDRLYGGARTSISGSLSSIEWDAGIDASFQRDDRINRATDIPNREFLDELTLDQLETVWNTSAFTYARLPLASDLHLTLGGRIDRVAFSLDDRLQVDGVDESGDRSFTAFSPGAGLSYQLGRSTLYANYNTAFDTPTTTELVNRPGSPGGFNQQLDPQRTRGTEIGARGTIPSLQIGYDVAAYYLNVQDRLVQQEIPDSGGRVFFENVGSNTHRGFEAALQWQPEPWLRITSAYTNNRILFQDDDLDGNRVPGVPDQRFSASASVEALGGYLRVAFDAVGDYYADNDNSAVSEAYELVDVHAGVSTLHIAGANVRPHASVRNVFDTQYNGSVSINANNNFFEPAPGRAFEVGITVIL